MWPAIIGSGISAIGNVVGGLLNSNNAQSANRLAEAQFDYNAQKQEEYFKNAILFRVQDAKRAGVHPLAALGAQIASPGAIAVGGGVADNGIGSGLAAAGQDIGRAVASMKGEDEKARAYADALRTATLTKTQAEIDYIRSMTVRNLGVQNPSMPRVVGNDRMLPGQGNSPLSVDTLSLINRSSDFQELTPIPDMGYARTATGWAPVPSNEMKQRVEDFSWMPFQWMLRNVFGPAVGYGKEPPPPGLDRLGKGEEWFFNPFKGEYQKVRVGSWKFHGSMFPRYVRE